MNKGILYGIGAYFLWGIFPIYWKELQSVSAIEIIGHRMAWSFVFVMLIIVFTGRWGHFRQTIQNRRAMIPFIGSALLLSANWLIYVWAINAGYIVETSLGYFINPLVNVLMGVAFLRERLRPWQWVSTGLASVGILYLTWRYGALPWIALSLAFTFAVYGLIKKQAALNSTEGFAVETGIMFLPALVYLLVLEVTGRGVFGHQSAGVTALLALAGVATGLPLLLFGAAARLIPLSMIGFLQYLAPTLQFLIGVFVYAEAFTRDRFIGFGLIWVALLIYSLEGLLARRNPQALAVAD